MKGMKEQDDKPLRRDGLDRLLDRATAAAAEDNPAAPSDTPAGTDPAPQDEEPAAPSEEKQAAGRKEQARKALQELISLDEETPTEGDRVTLRTVLGGDILAGPWFRRQVGYVVLLVVLSILYVGNRYACQREEIRREDLADTLTDRKFKVLTISSELTEFSMRSNVEENVPDTTLRTSVESSYYLPN